jgi:hypothetical protein
MSTDFDFTESGYAPSYDFDFGGAGVSIYSILKGLLNDFSSIWADPTASLTTGKMYVASQGTGASFSIVDISSNSVVDYYDVTHIGAAGEALQAEDIIDLNAN